MHSYCLRFDLPLLDLRRFDLRWWFALPHENHNRSDTRTAAELQQRVCASVLNNQFLGSFLDVRPTRGRTHALGFLCLTGSVWERHEISPCPAASIDIRSTGTARAGSDSERTRKPRLRLAKTPRQQLVT